MSVRRSIRPASRLARRLAVAAGALALPLLLAACASDGPRVQAAPAELFADAKFGPPQEPVDPEAVFRLSPAMREYMDKEILPAARGGDIRQALTRSLYDRRGLQLEYEASTTRNAAQAFEAREGNCLSLVIMTGAFAKALGLDVTFQEVSTDAMWSRAGDMYFMSGHVNLQLAHHLPDRLGTVDRVSLYTIDFLPSEQSGALRARPIDEKTVLAMYMNNRAAEGMLHGRLDDAYWRVRDALRLDPSFLSAYNTLGVIYLRHHDTALAAAALRFALDREPENAQVMTNYVQALRALGRNDEARAYETRLARLEPFPPFYFFNRGQAALHAGDYRAARDLFRRELARQPDYHEFHYWLAIADFDLGEVDEARRELKIALEDAVKRSDQDLYSAKLDKLNAAFRPRS